MRKSESLKRDSSDSDCCGPGRKPAGSGSMDYLTKKGIKLTESIVMGLIGMSDAFIVLVTGLGLYLFYPGWSEGSSITYLSAIFMAANFVFLVFYYADFYKINTQSGFKKPIGKLVAVYSIAFLVLISFTFALKNSEEFSRIWVFSWYLVSLVTLGFAQLFYARVINNWYAKGMISRNTAVIGANDQAIRLIESLCESNDSLLRVVGIYDERKDRAPTSICGHLVNNSIDDLIKEVREHRIDEVIIALPWSAENRVLEILDRLKVLPVPVRMCADMLGFAFPYREIKYYNGIPLLNMRDKPIDEWDAIAKSIFDRILAIIGLVVAAPLLLIVAALIKLDSAGPVFFIQNRYGFNNKPFKVYKFRTLHVDKQDESAETLVTKGDSRVTRIGSFLRRSSLDELPQILNVVKGDMSIVGPRPHAMSAKAAGKYYQDVVTDYAARHNVKPGITGWAQVNGWRGETDTEEKILKRVEYDLFYISNWSIWFDIRIIFLTFLALINDKNAY